MKIQAHQEKAQTDWKKTHGATSESASACGIDWTSCSTKTRLRRKKKNKFQLKKEKKSTIKYSLLQ